MIYNLTGFIQKDINKYIQNYSKAVVEKVYKKMKNPVTAFA